MSFTLTSTPTKTGTIYLSPSKRRKVSPPPQGAPLTTHAPREVYNWLFSADSFTSCSIHDALTMKENQLEDYDFYWLGRRPCRTVKVLGMIIGIQVYEKRIIYSIDDGTAVIDCYHPQSAPKQSPKKETTLSKYKAPAKVEPPPTLQPIGRIGKFVKVVGRVRGFHESRQIMVDSIELCSPNEELLHTRLVRHLHCTLYNQTGPFVIPPVSNTASPATPVKKNIPPTPSTMQPSPPSSVSSSPMKPEPDDTSDIPISPPKFRHPSRLHTHDLTENTFRIYVKHYMDYAPPPQDRNDTGYDSDEGIGRSIAQTPSTPTKRPRNTSSHETPRQSSSRPALDATPKARMAPPRRAPASEKKVVRAGFSLSYLRRIPELALLAYRVVEAVNRRRQRDERKRLREAGVISRSSHSTQRSKSSSSSSVMPIPRERLPGKMKRLFQWAIIQLLQEGCIVHWEGPIRRCPDFSSILNASCLWKSNTSDSTLLGDSTLFSSASTPLPTAGDEEDTGTLSDPAPNEEAYISLTGEYLADYVEGAIKVLVDHYAKLGKPYAGATKEGILSVLRKKDDRWRYVGDWTVEDALDVLRKEGRVWSLGKGRWDLTD